MQSHPSVTVVVATYNECDNLQPLVERLFNLQVSGLRMVVVDDNSPDGTGRLADRLSVRFPITVIHRPKKLGLGTAYARGFSSALDAAPKPDYLIEMDADFSHDPAVVPMLIERAKTCDLVLGSR